MEPWKAWCLSFYLKKKGAKECGVTNTGVMACKKFRLQMRLRRRKKVRLTVMKTRNPAETFPDTEIRKGSSSRVSAVARTKGECSRATGGMDDSTNVLKEVLPKVSTFCAPVPAC